MASSEPKTSLRTIPSPPEWLLMMRIGTQERWSIRCYSHPRKTELQRDDFVRLCSMTATKNFFVIKPEDLHWRPSNLMQIPNADYLERTGTEKLGARLWQLPPKSASTLHKHIRAE